MNMFKIKNSDENNTSGSDINMLAKGTLVEGNIQTSSDIRIDGTLHGSITTNAKIVIGPEGCVEGDMVCQSADILGKITGIIRVEGLLYLRGNAIIEGDIFAKQLEMENTVKFNGNCQMGQELENGSPENNHDKKTLNFQEEIR